MYAKLKKSNNQESLILLKACQSTDMVENQKLIFALDRGGLWYITTDFQKILENTENYLSTTLSNSIIPKNIDIEGIAVTLMHSSQVMFYFENIVNSSDIEVNKDVAKNTLFNILSLYIRVRTYSFVKDTVQDLRNRSVKVDPKLSLRKNLKNPVKEGMHINKYRL